MTLDRSWIESTAAVPETKGSYGADGLPGIGTSLLAKRLAKLEAVGVIERRPLPPTAAATVYELAPTSHELAAALSP